MKAGRDEDAAEYQRRIAKEEEEHDAVVKEIAAVRVEVDRQDEAITALKWALAQRRSQLDDARVALDAARAEVERQGHLVTVLTEAHAGCRAQLDAVRIETGKWAFRCDELVKERDNARECLRYEMEARAACLAENDLLQASIAAKAEGK